jgi:uncharacterized protein (TIGR02246 family)
VDAFSEADEDAIALSIAAVRQRWLEAVGAGDAERLVAMVTDDVVVVHGNGRCVHGRDELKADFLKSFQAYSIEQKVSSTEIVVRGRWALEISEVESNLASLSGGESAQFHSTTVVALNREADGSWKVGRVLGLVDAPAKSLK